MDLRLESPSKRQKSRAADPRSTVMTSTPLQSLEHQLPIQSVSHILSERPSSISRLSLSAQSLTSLQDERRIVGQPANTSSKSTDLDETFGRAQGLDESTTYLALNYDAFFEDLRGFCKTGKAWNWFKPLRGEGSQDIYTHILADVTNTKEVAEKFVDLFRKNPDVGLNLLITLVVDCAGYRKLNVLEKRGDISHTLKKILAYYGDDIVFENQKFLFRERSHQSTVVKMAIFSFIEKFIMYSYEPKVLFSKQFKDFVEFLYELCDSRRMNLMYAAAFFNMKVISSILMLISDLEDREVGLPQDKLRCLEMYMDTAYIVVAKLCKSNFVGLSQLKLAYIRELEVWITVARNIFVDYFESWKILTYHLIVDAIDKGRDSALVRLAALKLLEKMILNKNYVQYLKKHIYDIIRKLADRFRDINATVAIQALAVYKALGVHYYEALQNQRDVFVQMVRLIGDSSYEIGKAAATFLIDLLKLEVSESTELLASLARIAHTYHLENKHFVVEALIDHPSKIIQHWELYMSIFRDESMDMSDKVKVGDILLETIHQTLTGKSSEMRKNSRKVVVLRETRESVANYFLPVLEDLLIRYKKTSIFQLLLKLVMEFDAREFTAQHNQYLNDILAEQSLFQYDEDEKSFEAVADFLQRFGKYEFLKTRSTELVASLGKQYADEFIQQLHKEVKDQNLIVHSARKLSILFSRFDLNSYFKWIHLFDSWDVLDGTKFQSEYVANMMKCCRYSLIFKLIKLGHAILPRSVEDELVRETICQREQFGGACFNILQHTSDEMRRIAWNEISETYLLYAKELENISKQRLLLHESLPRLQGDDQLMDLFFKVFDKHIVRSKKVQESDKHKYAMFVINLTVYGQCLLVKLALLFKYYDQMFETYSQIIEQTFTYFQKTARTAVPGLFIHAIRALFEDVLQKHGVVDPNTSDAKAIMRLSKRFKNLPEAIDNSGYILFGSLAYVKSKGHNEFFVYVTPFVDNVSAATKSQLLEKMGEYFTSDLRNESISNFVGYLKRAGNSSLQKKKGSNPKRTNRGKEQPLTISAEPPKRRDPEPKKVTTGGATPLVKGLEKKRRQLKLSQSTESNSSSSKMSIHDTSDPSDEFASEFEKLSPDN